MISLDQLVQCLNQTFHAELSEVINQAVQIIDSQFQYPEFPSLLCQLISSSTVQNENYIRSSIIFLKRYLNSNPQIMADISIPLLHQLTQIVPPQLQLMLELISDDIIKFYDQNKVDPSQPIQQLFSSDSPIAGFLLLNSFLVNQNNSIPSESFEFITTLIHSEFEFIGALIPVENPLKALYLHYFSESFIMFMLNCTSSSEESIPVIVFSIEIIKANITSSFIDIPNDYLEIIRNFVIMHPEQFDISPFLEAVTVYFQNSPSFSGLAQFFRIMKAILAPENEEEQAIQKSQEISDEVLDQILTAFFFPVFTISEDEQTSFEADPIQFIDSIFSSYDEEETPKSAASSCLYYATKLHPSLPNIIFKQVLQLLSSEINEWQILSIILYFSPVSQSFTIEAPEFEQFVSSVIATNLQSQNPILFISSLIFLANFPISFISNFSEHFLPFFFQILSQSSDQFLPSYLACCAAGHFLSHLTLPEETNPLSVVGLPPEGLTQAIQNVFLTSDQLSNQRIASSVSSIVAFFSSSDENLFGQFTEQAVQTLITLLLKYMDEDIEEARMYSTSIISEAICSLCSSLSNPEVLDYVIGQVNSMIENQLHLNYLEEILPLIDGCVNGSQTPTEAILSIPSILVNFMFNEGGLEEAFNISQIFKRFTLKYLPVLVEAQYEDLSSLFIAPITQMIEPLIEDCELADETEIGGICTYCQLLFIYINTFFSSKQIALPLDLNELIPVWLQAVINVDSPFAADAMSSMIQFNPILTLNESNREEVCQKWISSSNPKAFLASAMIVLQNLQELGMESVGPQILEHGKAQLQILQSEDYENCENDEFFDMKAINAFYTQS